MKAFKKDGDALEQEFLSRAVGAHGNGLANFCVRLCKNRDEAEDLYQETWASACRSIETYDEERPFEKWLYTICINTHKNRCRHWLRHRRLELPADPETDADMQNAADGEAQREYDAVLLGCVVDSLPDRYRTILYNDFTLEEIAETLHIPLGTVKSRIHKAKQLLRRHLEHE